MEELCQALYECFTGMKHLLAVLFPKMGVFDILGVAAVLGFIIIDREDKRESSEIDEQNEYCEGDSSLSQDSEKVQEQEDTQDK